MASVGALVEFLHKKGESELLIETSIKVVLLLEI